MQKSVNVVRMRQCPICGKKFPGKAALKQHVASAHPTPATSSRKKKVTLPRQSRTVGAVVGGAPLDTATLAGTDRIYHDSDVSTRGDHSLLFDKLIEPPLFKRLSTICTVFQRIRYDSLRIVVQSQVNEQASGGYVVAFIPDPADSYTNVQEADLLDRLTSAQGSVTQKWSQSATIARAPTGVFFTSQSTDLREYSPGRLVMAVDGRSTQNGSITIFVHWKATLYDASMEVPRQQEATYSAAVDFWNQNGHGGLFYKVKEEFRDDIQTMIPNVRLNDIFELPYPVATPRATTYERYFWLIATGRNDLNPSSTFGTADPAQFIHTNVFIPAGTILKKVNRRSGEALAASPYDMTTPLELKSNANMRKSLENLMPSSSSLVEPMDCLRTSEKFSTTVLQRLIGELMEQQQKQAQLMSSAISSLTASQLQLSEALRTRLPQLQEFELPLSDCDEIQTEKST